VITRDAKRSTISCILYNPLLTLRNEIKFRLTSQDQKNTLKKLCRIITTIKLYVKSITPKFYNIDMIINND
jgi:hypothetical protein